MKLVAKELVKIAQLIINATDYPFMEEVAGFFDVLRTNLNKSGWIDSSRVRKNIHGQTYDKFEMNTKEKNELFDKPNFLIESSPHQIKFSAGVYKIKLFMYNSMGMHVRGKQMASIINGLGFKATPTADGVSITIPIS